MDGVNFSADMSLQQNSDEIIPKLKEEGWKHLTLKVRKGAGYTEDKFGILIRDVSNPLKRGKSFVNHEVNFTNEGVSEKNKGLTQIEEYSNHAALNTSEDLGVGNDYGCPIVEIDPHSFGNAVKSLGNIPTVSRMKEDEPRLTIAIDTEFVYDPDGRKILSWQFAFSDYDLSVVHQVVIFSLHGDRLPLGLAISWITSFFQLYNLPYSSLKNKGFLRRDTRRWIVPCLDDKSGELTYVTCRTFDEALETCNVTSFVDSLNNVTSRHKLNPKIDGDVGYVNDYSDYNNKALPITLLFHTGIADLTGFGFTDFDKDVLRRVSSVSGGLVSILGFYTYPSDVFRYWNFYPVHIVIRDTMCFAPAKKKSLANLGDSIGVENAIRNEISKALSDKLEATLLGNGAGNAYTPAGLFSYTAITTGAVEDFSGITTLDEGVEEVGVDLNACKYIVSPSAKASLRNMAKSTKSTQLVMEGNEIDGTQALCTAHVPSGKIVYGDWSNLVIANWDNVQIDVVRDSANLINGQVMIIINAFVDGVVVRPEAFAIAEVE